MIEYIVYVTSLLVFFTINLKVLQALHIERKFEKMKLWEIKTAYFIVSLTVAHLLSDMMVRLTQLVDFI
jgi:uncharacterized membrane protein YwzB